MTNLTIIMYHYVRPIKYSMFPNIKGLELEAFRFQLDNLSSQYTFLTSDQLIGYSQGINEIPKNACYLTFDDGYKDHIKYVMPELLSRNIQGSFFPSANAIEGRQLLDVNALHYILAVSKNNTKLVDELNDLCSDLGISTRELIDLKRAWYVGGRYDQPQIKYFKNMLQHALPKKIREEIISTLFKKYVATDQNDFCNDLYMSVEDVKELIGNGMYVGGHGYNHIWLDKESKESQLVEIDNSINFLKKIGAQTRQWIMCYPYGAYNYDTLEILKTKNCAVGLTVRVGIAELNINNMLELSRFDTNDFF